MADIAERKGRDSLRHRVHAARWIAANPEKRRAHHDVRNAIRRGTLERQPCGVCGERAEAHHPDYAATLEVEWLCRKHHAEKHREGLESRRHAHAAPPEKISAPIVDRNEGRS